MKCYVINGVGGCGKDTFVKLCKQHIRPGLCLNISTIDIVKDLATACGWDGTKTPDNRAYLSELKQILTDYDDLPHKSILQKIKNFEEHLRNCGLSARCAAVFIHCREPQEIAKLVRDLNASTILIRREAAESIEQSNSSDAGVFDYEYDYIIPNNGTIKDLDCWALNFVEMEGMRC